MDLLIASDGAITCLYDEAIDLASLGEVQIQRASYVEPSVSGGEAGSWSADLAPVGGPRLGPFDRRSEALAAEQSWLSEWLGVRPMPNRSVRPQGR